MSENPKEYVVLLDESGKPIGQAEKFSTHHSKTPLHLAFSCYVFNDKGQVLVTQRALEKKVWPSVWTNSVCGHPAPGEAMPDAIARRLDYELGMTASDLQIALPDYRYTTPPYKGIIENEVCPVYVARATSLPNPNPTEVAAHKWLNWNEFLRETASDTDDVWSWWCKDQLKQLQDVPVLQKYIQA